MTSESSYDGGFSFAGIARQGKDIVQLFLLFVSLFLPLSSTVVSINQYSALHYLSDIVLCVIMNNGDSS